MAAMEEVLSTPLEQHHQQQHQQPSERRRFLHRSATFRSRSAEIPPDAGAAAPGRVPFRVVRSAPCMNMHASILLIPTSCAHSKRSLLASICATHCPQRLNRTCRRMENALAVRILCTPLDREAPA